MKFLLFLSILVVFAAAMVSCQDYIGNNGRRHMIMEELPSEMVEPVEIDEIALRRIIDVPHQCPKGYRPDALGNCRKRFP